MVLVATQVKRRRGTTAENDAFTGAEGEIVVDTERHELRVHDGVTQGGFRIGGGSSLVIGQILEVVGTADYTPEGCLLADGAEYTKAQFPNLWADFLTGTPKLQTCTYTEYANQIAEYGFCNKFAVDTTNETFKVPTRNKYRKLVKKIVNGTTWANLYDDGWCEQGGYVSTTADAYLITMPIEMANTNYIINVSTKSSSVSAPQDNNQAYRNTAFIAGNAFYNQTTTGFGIRSASWLSFVGKCWHVSGYAPIPDSTSNITREFVVVANGTLNEEQMDWSAWASSLAGKANIDLSNTPANIDYVVESQEPTAGNGYTWYRKYKSGWVEQGGRLTQSGTATLPVEMSNNNYDLQVRLDYYSTGTIQGLYWYATKTATGFTMGTFATSIPVDWQVSGKSAQ